MSRGAAFFLPALLASALAAPAFAADGRAVYAAHCARCHGAEGRGDGPAHTMQRPRPLDFTSGDFEYRSTPLGHLPARADVERTVREGVLRTSMPPFEGFLSEEEIRAVAAHVLELARASGLAEGEPAAIARPAELDAAPPAPEALAEGKELYAKYRCADCHGADGRGLGRLSGGLVDDEGFWTVPSDLTDPDAYGGGAAASDIFLRLMAGMGDVMPSYAETIPPDEAKKIALYVKSLQVPASARPAPDAGAWRRALPAKARGEYLVRAMSCALCHNYYDARGMYAPDAYLAGGVAIRIPGLGTFPTRNLTSHPEFGLGRWTEDEIVRAVTAGTAPDRRLEAFAMPWVFFSHLEPEDARAIAAYLKTLAPVPNRVPPRRFDPFWKRLLERVRQLLGLAHGRLEYPPGNAGEMAEP
jgi:mono/diheme cytochrome c family protein